MHKIKDQRVNKYKASNLRKEIGIKPVAKILEKIKICLKKKIGKQKVKPLGIYFNMIQNFIIKL